MGRDFIHTKKDAYKIDNGQYGVLMINVPRLMNEMVIETHKGGQIVYEDKRDKSLVDLLTKRFDPKKRYSLLYRTRRFNEKTDVIDRHKKGWKYKYCSTK